jgi:FlaA1/EpsC-like NDP-sugar epimerase
MPLLTIIFYGNTWIKFASYLKALLLLTILNFLTIYFLKLKGINNESSTFLLFVMFSILTRIAVYFLFKIRNKRKKIRYFEIITYRYIFVKGVILTGLLIVSTYLALNEEIFFVENLLNIRIWLLAVFIVLGISIFEDIEAEAQKVLQNMRDEQQMEIERNYLNAISTRTRELAKVRHDIKDHMFMINYLAEKEDMKGIKEYLGKIPVVEGNALITIPQKEWLGALIYSKAEQAKKLKIKFDFENYWNPELEIKVDNMDMLSLVANLLDNAIEAAQKVTDEDKKRVRLTLRENKNYLMIDVQNYYNANHLNIIDNRFKTTKRDEQLHGKGIDIIKEIAAKYIGDFFYDIKEDEIMMKITLQNVKIG